MKSNQESNNQNKCSFCGRTFVRENTILKHLCEQKTRYLDTETKAGNRVAFQSWLKFYDLIRPGRKKKKEIKDFISSAYYSAFVKFGNYCVDTKIVDVESYLTYLLKENISIDLWVSDKVYTNFLILFLRNENCFDAVKRSISNLVDISVDQNIKLKDIFIYFNSNKLCHLIVNGKLSPWLLYNCDQGTKFLSSLNNDQIKYIFDYIDPEKWKIKFLQKSDDVNELKKIITEVFES